MSRLVCLLLLGHLGEVVDAYDFQYRDEFTDQRRTRVVRRCTRCSHTWVQVLRGVWSLESLRNGGAS